MRSSIGASILAAAAVAAAEGTRYVGHSVEVEAVFVLGMEATEHNCPPVCAGSETAAAILAHLCLDNTLKLGLKIGALLVLEVVALTALAFAVEKSGRVVVGSLVMCSRYRRLSLALE